MTGKVLVILGTSSSVGKSLLVTGLCHLFARRGVKVAPFKAQNMSNNAAVFPDGSEIGRAQYTQALACGLEPHVDMNPVLIKPEADSRSQVVVMGRPWQTLDAREYYPKKDYLWKQATGALNRLRMPVDWKPSHLVGNLEKNSSAQSASWRSATPMPASPPCSTP